MGAVRSFFLTLKATQGHAPWPWGETRLRGFGGPLFHSLAMWVEGVWGILRMARVGSPLHSSYAMNSGPFASHAKPYTSDVGTATAAAEPVLPSVVTHPLVTLVFNYLQARSVLLRLETQEAVAHFATASIWVAIGAIAAFAGWLLLAASLVGVLTMCLGWSWVKATAVVGAAHLLIALSAALKAKNQLTAAHWFADSVSELKKDRAWLNTQVTKN